MALSPAAIQRGLFLFLCLVWGTNWLAMKAGTAEVPPGLFSGLRWSVAGAALLVFLALRGTPVRIPPRLWGRIIWVSVMMIPLNAVIMLYGLRHISSGLAAVLNSALTPIAMVAFAAMLGQERFSRRHLAALAVGAFALALFRGGRRFGGGIATLLAVQLTLGILAIQLPQNPHVRTVHLVSGAALFSLVVAATLLAHRREGALGDV